jgi:hypothetical protein
MRLQNPSNSYQLAAYRKALGVEARCINLIVNSVNDGNTYKVELFNGRILISYVLKKRPLGERLLAGDLDADGFRRLAVYREAMERPDERHRELFEFPDADKFALRQLSRRMTDIGLGYVCVDLMRQPDGSFVAIELNLSGVTTWWTASARRPITTPAAAGPNRNGPRTR